MTSGEMRVDPVTQEIIEGKLVATVDEMGIVMARTSMSPVIYEILDFACGLLTADAELVAQMNGITLFTGTFGVQVRALIEKFSGNLADGDILLSNDPYAGGTHACDFAIVKPLFVDGDILGYAINVAHYLDVGGSVPGSLAPDATSVFQEGLRLPGVKVVRSDVFSEEILHIIGENVRLPEIALGDLNAQIATVRVAARRMTELASKYGVATVKAAFARMLDASEALSRAAIAALPDGRYAATDIIDGDGVSTTPIPVEVVVTIAGDRIIADFTGCPPAVAGPINCARGALQSAVKTIVKAMVGPQEPSNEGWFRPLTVIAPSGTIFTAEKPSPTGWYYEGSVHASELVWKALAPLMPSRFSAGSYSSLCVVYISGKGRNGQPFIHIEPQHGGWGASEDRDGANALIALTDGDTYNYSVEVIEARFPLRVRRYGFNVAGGTGAGRRRGGFGIVREYEILSDDASAYGSFGRTATLPWGMDGGSSGTANVLQIAPADRGKPQSYGRVAHIDLTRGDILRVVTGGGGGWGDPRKREPALVEADLDNGFVTDAEALNLYGYRQGTGAMIRLATDVGGTFTDLVGYDERSGELFTAKSLTTADDQSIGVLDAIASAEARDGLRTRDVIFFAHGGTTVINAITERKGVRTALITTAGFRDVLEIGRGNRPDLYNLQFHSPEPFVPRHLRFEVRERLDADGNVLVPLVLDDLRPIIARCREQDIEAIAILFLHSYANPEHEILCAGILSDALPGCTICASHEVSRQWREYERSNTVVLNAYVQPIIRHYFERLERALTRRDLTCPYYAMQSNGGISTFEQAIASPLTLVESGPAGGVAGAARIGGALGESEVLSLDVGGTTAKCSLIHGGRPTLNVDYKLEHTRIAPGHPVQVPVVDIVEIGSGGGSIARIDDRGALRVGPESAGSAPGPACYGNGGTQPTLSDAILTLGVFDPAKFAGGTMHLDKQKAADAIATIAAPLGMSIEDAALAIIDIAHASMINALKLVTVQRGHDPRDAVLVVSGGAGPALATRLGRDLAVKATVIPPHPGIFSAWGMLAAEPRADLRGTWFAALSADALMELSRRFDGLEGDSITYFAKGQEADIRYTYQVEARYRGQEHGVFTAFGRDDDVASFTERFHAAHERAYSFRLPAAAIEITTLHLEAVLNGAVITLPRIDRAPDGQALTGHRAVYFGGAFGWVSCPVYARGLLAPGRPLAGPLIVEEATATTLVQENQMLDVTDTGILIIRETSAEAG